MPEYSSTLAPYFAPTKEVQSMHLCKECHRHVPGPTEIEIQISSTYRMALADREFIEYLHKKEEKNDESKIEASNHNRS
jgi:hypothetical protein